MNRDVEVELVHYLAQNKNTVFGSHFLKDSRVYIDNIHGGFDSCSMPITRESGVGRRYRTWVRARWLVYALLDQLGMPPILAFLEERKDIKGIGISDDLRYAAALAAKFSYVNTFYHQEPMLDIMVYSERYGISDIDFIICSDVLEHVIGDWRCALLNFYRQLKPGGILVFTVPWSIDFLRSIEHYPGCVDYQVLLNNGVLDKVVIINSDGSSYNAEKPYFHGGPGNTLEMRVFSFGELLDACSSIGFSDYMLYQSSIPVFGVFSEEHAPGVLVLRK